jgi:protein-S-isoprenylcysteine O-methyltransferase Ste14
MSLTPAFEIGVWNAWIFMSYLLLSFIPFFYIATKRSSPSVKDTGLSKVAKMFAGSSKILLLPATIYSIFLPMKTGTVWFYAGLPIALMGLLAYTIVLENWATTPVNSEISRGLYRYSRHPMYLSMFVFLLGLGILTASWVMLLFFVIFVVGCAVYTNVEERSCIEKWGDSYRGYMARTPRWLGIPKGDKPAYT